MVGQMAAGKAGKQPAAGAGLLPEEGELQRGQTEIPRERQRAETEQTERRRAREGAEGRRGKRRQRAERDRERGR